MDSTKAEEESPSSRPLKVVFAGPAKHWTDAAPVGNSRLGAMIWGGVGSETLQFNDDTLWTSVPCDYTNPQTPIILSKVRKLVDDGQVAEASLAANDLLGQLQSFTAAIVEMLVQSTEQELYLREIFCSQHFCSQRSSRVVSRWMMMGPTGWEPLKLMAHSARGEQK